MPYLHLISFTSKLSMRKKCESMVLRNSSIPNSVSTEWLQICTRKKKKARKREREIKKENKERERSREEREGKRERKQKKRKNDEWLIRVLRPIKGVK